MGVVNQSVKQWIVECCIRKLYVNKSYGLSPFDLQNLHINSIKSSSLVLFCKNFQQSKGVAGALLDEPTSEIGKFLNMVCFDGCRKIWTGLGRYFPYGYWSTSPRELRNSILFGFLKKSWVMFGCGFL